MANKDARKKAVSRMADDAVFGQAAHNIAITLESDSGIPVKESEPKILDALRKDVTDVSKLPQTEEELELLVMPEDDVGEEIAKRFPNTVKVLNSFF
jgi:hypothetical protein